MADGTDTLEMTSSKSVAAVLCLIGSSHKLPNPLQRGYIEIVFDFCYFVPPATVPLDQHATRPLDKIPAWA